MLILYNLNIILLTNYTKNVFKFIIQINIKFKLIIRIVINIIPYSDLLN